jgi:hypothetical protein
MEVYFCIGDGCNASRMIDRKPGWYDLAFLKKMSLDPDNILLGELVLCRRCSNRLQQTSPSLDSFVKGLFPAYHSVLLPTELNTQLGDAIAALQAFTRKTVLFQSSHCLSAPGQDPIIGYDVCSVDYIDYSRFPSLIRKGKLFTIDPSTAKMLPVALDDFFFGPLPSG